MKTKYVYIMVCCENLYKIGISDNPHKRRDGVQAGNPFEVSLVFSRLVDDAAGAERLAHGLVSHARVRGEWYKLSPPEYRDVVEAITSNYEEVEHGETGIRSLSKKERAVYDLMVSGGGFASHEDIDRLLYGTEKRGNGNYRAVIAISIRAKTGIDIVPVRNRGYKIGESGHPSSPRLNI